MKILIVGDVFSKLGRASFERNIKRIKEQEKINFIIVNGENTSHGRGLNQGHYLWYLEQGVNVITLGNHAYQNKSILNFIDEANNIVRPYNFPENSPGKGYCTVNYNGITITVFQVVGKVFMSSDNDDPFKKTEELLENVKSDIYICDFHGEATSEKIAFGYAFDGRVQVIFGTHTHVQTNDARILDKGTAYITDVGMTGPLDGVIGMKKEIIIDRYLNDGMQRFSPQETGKTQFCAIIIEINERTKKVAKIDKLYVIE
ncbi:MAG: TIGR00282 family metallophosphoesterase [Acholeplasmataceae bacterium]|nr:TIGR00282 family metallophosphoesterase [Acholeplasmataceae bacterium]